jgi:hypothetical protein
MDERSLNNEVLVDKNSPAGQAHWLMPIVPATQGTEIERIIVPDQPRQKVGKTPSQPMLEPGGVCLSSQLCKRLKERLSRRSKVQAGQGKKYETLPRN